MSNEKFTKGPWEAGCNPIMATMLDGKEGKTIYPEDGTYHIAWANIHNEDGELDMETALANARLIAAAPEMHALLERILAEVEMDALPVKDRPQTYRKIRMLLAKVHGGDKQRSKVRK